MWKISGITFHISKKVRKSVGCKRIHLRSEIEVDFRLLLHSELDRLAQVRVGDCAEIVAVRWSKPNERVAFLPEVLAELRC